MVNRSTVRTDDLEKIRRASFSVLEKVKKKQHKVSKEEEIEKVTGKFFEKILTGKADTEDTLEFLATERSEGVLEEDHVVNLRDYKKEQEEQNSNMVGFSEFEARTEKKEDLKPETSKEDNVDYLEEYKTKITNNDLKKKDDSFENILEDKLTEVLVNENQLSETEQIETIRDFLKDTVDIPDGEVEVEAKRTFLEIKNFEEKHPEEIRAIKRENLAKKFEEETKKKNSNKKLTELQEKALRDEAHLLADVFYGNEGLKDSDLNQTKYAKPIKLEVIGVVGLLSKKPESVDEVLKKHRTNLGNLDGVVLPLGEMPHYGVFDRLMNSMANQRVRSTFDLVHNGNWQQRLKTITGRKSIVETSGGFINKVGNQNTQEFVQSALAIFSTPNINFYGGLGNVLRGIVGNGTQIISPGFGGGFGSISPPGIPGISSLGSKLLGGIGNGAKNLGPVLGAGLKNGLASGFNGLGGAVKGLTNAIPQVRVAKTAAMTATVLIIAVVFGLMGISMAETNQISSLVPPVEDLSYYTGYSSLGSAGIASCATGSNLNINNFYNIDFTQIVTKIPQNSYIYKENKDIDFSCIKGLLPESGTHKRSDIIKTAYALMGIPYWMGGGHKSSISTEIDSDWGKKVNTPRSGWNDGRSYHGLDCSGFVRWVYNYVTGVTVGGLSGDIYSKSKKINKTELQPGDIGFLYGTGTNHIGIFFGRGTNGKYYFIHSSGRSSKAGPQALGGVYISAANFTHFGRIVSAGLIDE